MQTFIDFGEIIPTYFGPNGLLSVRDSEVPNNEKGLRNYMGENNCFLNVVIQSLWHLEPFREKFRHPKVQAAHKKISPHPENCVFCSLEVIFTQYEFSEDREVPPTALRQTMAILYKAQSKFQLFEIDDAAEAFEAVVGGIHDELTSKDALIGGKSCSSKYCVPHRVFGINAVDQVKCNRCGAESEPIKTTLFSGYAYAAGLRKYPKATFCQLLSLSSADRRLCPNKQKCNNLCTIDHSITSLPEVFTVGVVWENADATLSEIETMLNMISWQIDLNNIFTLDVINNPKLRKKSTLYKLKGMICYYGKHYTAYFYSFKNLQWFMFDDATVKPVGVDWLGIRDRCLRGRVKPTMLFYETVEPSDNLIESSIEFQHHPFSEAIESLVPVPSSDVPTKQVLSQSTLFIEPLGGVAIKKTIEEVTPKAPKLEEIAPKPIEDVIPKAPKPIEEVIPKTPKTIEEVIPKPIEVIPKLIEVIPKPIDIETVTNAVHTTQKNSNTSIPIVNTVDATVQTENSPRPSIPPSQPQVIPPKVEEKKETPISQDVKIEPIQTPNDSFVLLPSKDEMDKEREFVVTRINWLYRRQSRIYRFTQECFFRIVPETNTIKERFEYRDVLEITTVDDNNLIIRFYSDKEPQYITSPQVKDILAFLTKKAAAHNHKFKVKPPSLQ